MIIKKKSMTLSHFHRLISNECGGRIEFEEKTLLSQVFSLITRVVAVVVSSSSLHFMAVIVVVWLYP